MRIDVLLVGIGHLLSLVTSTVAHARANRRAIAEVLGDAVGAASLMGMIFVLAFLGELFR